MMVRKLAVRRLAPLALLLPLAGCKTWEPASAPPTRVIAESRPPSVRITTVDGAQVTLKNPLLVNDSIVSSVAPPPGTVVIPPRVGVPERDVNLVEVPSLSTGRTIAFVAAIAGASIGWARIQGLGGGRDERPEPLPKDSAFDIIGIVRLLIGAF